MSAACLWNRDGRPVAVTVLRTEGDDIPDGHYQVLVIPSGATEFAPIADLKPHNITVEITKHSKENHRA